MDVKSRLTPHQLEVFEKITSKIKENLSSRVSNISLSDRFLSLTGAAGTGKSFLTSAIVDEIDNFMPVGQYEICVTAPTHKALKVLTAMVVGDYYIGVKSSTIHSFLNMKQFYDYSTGAENFIVDRSKDKINRASLLIVDESSIVSNELFDFIFEIVKKGYVNTVLFIGDLYQLLPVNQSSLNNVFRLKNQFTLTKIVRQAKNSTIIELATKIRVCISNEEYEDLRDILENTPNSEDIQFFDTKKEFLEDFCRNNNWHEEDKILASFTNNEVDSFNNILRRKFWQKQGIDNPKYLLPNDRVRFKKPSFDRFSENPRVIFQTGEEVIIDKAELLFDEELEIYYWECLPVGRSSLSSFKLVDPNSMDKFNDILNDYAYFAKIRNYPFNIQWWDKYFKLRDSFSDVQYTFASTIHKLQGSTYETLYFDLASLLNNRQISRDFLYRLVYVAITRAKKKIKILY